MSSIVRLSALLSVCGTFLACAAPAEEFQNQQDEALNASKKTVREYRCIVDPAGATESVVVRPSFGEVETTDGQGLWRSEDELKIVARAKEVTVKRDGKNAQTLLTEFGPVAAPNALRAQFKRNFHAALSELHSSAQALPDCFAHDGSVIAQGEAKRVYIAQFYFLRGTFGICVADPMSESRMAKKEVLQEKLTVLAENGSKATFVSAEIPSLLSRNAGNLVIFPVV